MPYTVKKPPDWLKNLPEGAIKIGVEVFNATLADTDDEDKARQAAWGAIKNKYEKEGDTWRAKTDVSLDDIRDMLWKALQDRDKEAYLSQVYGGYLIYEKTGKHYRLSYSILEGEVHLGSEPAEVERIWVETRAQQDEGEDGLTMLMRLGAARDVEGSAWDVTVCEPGFTKNGWYLPDKALEAGAPLFEGVDVNIYELPGKGATHVSEALFDVKSLLIKHKAAWLDGAKYIAGKGITAVLHFVDSYKWLGKNLLEAARQGAQLYGLSYDCPVLAAKSIIEGRTVAELKKFLAVDSVDIVTRPAAGGKFNRAVAQAAAPNNPAYAKASAGREDLVMDKKKLWEMITEKRPDLLKDKDFEKIGETELVEIARMAMTPAVDLSNGGTDSGKKADPPADKNNTAIKDQIDRFRCEMALDKALAGSDLPEAAQVRIRASFSDAEGVVRIYKAEDLQRAIAAEKDYLAAMTEAALQSVPAEHVRAGIGTLEKAQMAVDRLFGLAKTDVEACARMETLDHEPFFVERVGAAGFHVRSVQDVADYEQVPAFRSLREMYAFFTGDPEVSGFFNRRKLPPELRSRMDITSGTFTYVLGNTLGRRLVAEYLEADYLEGLIISVRKPVRDFRSQEAVLVGGFPDLATVDPEAADYEEIAAVTDEESTYTLGQKGNILTITRKTIINDDLSIIDRLVRALGRTARRTHGKYVWAKYIDNDACTDGTAVFTSGHGNLGATALSHTTALAAWVALAGMTEKDSGAYLGLLDGQNVTLNLIGPTALKALVGRIEKEEFYYSSNDLTTKLPNSLFGQVKGYTLSLLNADANDWYVTLPPGMTDLVEMGYLNGRQEPEMFVADSPQSEQIFVADKVRHKIRHEYAGTPVDYRGAYKAVVA